VAPGSRKGRKAARSSAVGKESKAGAGSKVSNAGRKAAAAAAPAKARAAAKRSTTPAAGAAAAAGPGRAPSAYNMFVREQGKELMQLSENKGKRMLQVTAAAWKSMSAKQKQPFLDLAAAPSGKP
jgi:hypothetical protein